MDNHKKNIEFTLCYTKIGNIWSCEYGYKTIQDTDNRVHELIKTSRNLTSKVFITRAYIPKILHKQYIRYNLNPAVNMIQKNN